MRTISKLAITIALGLSVAACAQGAPAPSHVSMNPGMMPRGIMMGSGVQDGTDHGMPGMMQQMSRIMDNCDKMMESHMQRENAPQQGHSDHDS
jgi:hypothetical protein